MFVFSGISSLMENENFWVDLSLSKLMGEDKTESIITWFDSAAIQNSLDLFFYDIPLFGIIGGMGLVSLVISFFMKEQ